MTQKEEIAVDTVLRSDARRLFDRAKVQRENARIVKSGCSTLTDGDPWKKNFKLHEVEIEEMREEVRAYPPFLSFPVSMSCNSRCVFCDAHEKPRGFFPCESLKRFGEMMRMATYIGLAGYGEALLHPEIERFMEIIVGYTDPRCTIALQTNGFLLRRHFDMLMAHGMKTVALSLNASNRQMHARLMGCAETRFDEIIRGVERVMEARDQGQNLEISLSAVVTHINLEDIIDFIDLCEKYNADYVFLRKYFLPLGAAQVYEGLPAYFHPDFLRLRKEIAARIEASSLNIKASPELWGLPLVESHQSMLPGEVIEENRVLSTENRKFRTAPFRCKQIYGYLNVGNLECDVPPCCFMSKVPGYDQMRFTEDKTYHALWNEEGMRLLRRRLARGPLFEPCLTCDNI